jgi:glycerol-3-phosphate dehydrogenase (NAD(P)+)
MTDTVSVIGAGSWGTTLAKILGDNGRRVLLWSRNADQCRAINRDHRNERYLPGFDLPKRIEATTDLQLACESTRLILLVVPSHGLRKVAFQMGDFLGGDQMIVHATKGIEIETGKRMSQVIREETCVRKVGVLSGPNLARELAARKPAGTLIASPFDEVFLAAQEALHNSYFRAYAGHDVVGAEVGGAFKNIIAVAAGVADGLELGDNTKALLLTRGLNEMARLGDTMGGAVMTFGGMAGIGDLMCTCASSLSRNHQVGERLAAGQRRAQIEREMHMVAEGVKTTKAIHLYSRYKGLDLPIAEAVHQLLYSRRSVKRVIEELMARPAADEFGELGG